MILRSGKTEDDTGNTRAGRISGLALSSICRTAKTTPYHVKETNMKRFASILAAFALALSAATLAKEDSKKVAAAPAATEKKAAAEPMDINTASEKDLATLKGIGEARAKAIVKGRPYKGKNELADKKIIPENVYNDIKDQIIAKQPDKKAGGKSK
jgi:competence protein ComEA